MPVILAVLSALLVWSAGRADASLEGRIEAEHPSDYVRVLETDQPELWEEAVEGLLGDDEDLPVLSVSSVVRRFDALAPQLQVRVVRALAEFPHHPKTTETLWRLAHGSLNPEPGDPEQTEPTTPKEAILALVHGKEAIAQPTPPTDAVRDVAEETLLMLYRKGRLPEEWARRLEPSNGETAEAKPEEPQEVKSVVEEVAEPRLATPVLIASAVLSGIVGMLLFIWAFRLSQLAIRVRNRPVSKVSALAMGPVALEGEVQPAEGYLRHPLTGEACVYYAGADRDHPEASFFLEDGSGRVLVDPRRAVLFSDDDVLVAGERVHLVGFAARDPHGKPIIRKDDAAPPLYRGIVHGAIRLLFGFGRATSVTRMLFSDPHRCFWIWDDLERRPLGESKDVLWPAFGFLLGGAWMVVFALAVLGLLDEGAVNNLIR